MFFNKGHKIAFGLPLTAENIKLLFKTLLCCIGLTKLLQAINYAYVMGDLQQRLLAFQI